MQTQKWQIHGTMWWRFQKWPSFYKRRSLRAYKSSSLSFLEFLSYHRNNNDISTNPVIELWIYKSWTKCCQEQSTSIIIAMRHWFLEENGRCKWYSYIIPNHHNGKQLNKHIIYNSSLTAQVLLHYLLSNNYCLLFISRCSSISLSGNHFITLGYQMAALKSIELRVLTNLSIFHERHQCMKQKRTCKAESISC